MFFRSNLSCLYEFTRGIKTCQISNVCFDTSAEYLAVSSNTGTIHLFSLTKTSSNEAEKKEEKTDKKQEKQFLEGIRTLFFFPTSAAKLQIGRASCRESVLRLVEISEAAGISTEQLQYCLNCRSFVPPDMFYHNATLVL